jgi:hypothetical protein
VTIEGEVLTFLPEGAQYQLDSAVHLLREVAESGDPDDLVGRVKSTAVLLELGGDVSHGTVVLGDSAYEVVEGFLGRPLEFVAPAAHDTASSLAEAFGAAGDDDGRISAFFTRHRGS